MKQQRYTRSQLKWTILRIWPHALYMSRYSQLFIEHVVNRYNSFNIKCQSHKEQYMERARGKKSRVQEEWGEKYWVWTKTCIAKSGHLSLSTLDKFLFISLNINVQSVFQYLCKFIFPFLLNSLQLIYIYYSTPNRILWLRNIKMQQIWKESCPNKSY